ncbi:MAG: ferredoxin:protochlorophyllide reductase (ATP-dependent) subunit B [Chloroflexi bacterium]|uniref:Light-independent protochlorophyllide reductase subunit B n=1 Tax=Candidatus Chlorohelix allophototropha TaxID=3003348 RepID=A0A8T7LZA1_9CHLR|nr:ferredoxin:protochlorophyllide reductase (ATP-dependent) subunit B [Chloroflexota bacterium]WJW65708.1 ferredoxin:protochlorophyllide reductase (ATP-dependent) subunit B [Chloroflexota bacterium L227-S17]
MRMSFWEYQGTAHTGVARVASSMNGVHAVAYSPVGDCYINSMFTMMEREKRFPPVHTSVLDLKTMGMGINRLPESLREVSHDHNPDLIVVTQTCSSSLLQEDYGSLARQANIPNEVLIYAPNPFRVEEDESANGLLTVMVEQFAAMKLPPTSKPSVNIIGPISLGFHHKHDLLSLQRMLETMGIAVNVVFPLGATVADIKKLPQAWATIAPYREMGADAAIVLEKMHNIPAVTSAPIGVVATRKWVREVLESLNKFASGNGLTFDLKEPAIAAFSMDQKSAPSGLPWFTITADVQGYSSKKAFVFGDFTHAVAITRMLATELDMQIVGAGTYNRKLANEFRELVKPYTDNIICSSEFAEVRKAIGETLPDIVMGTQMERHTSAEFDIPCATISNPTHIEDFSLSYQPFLGYDGSNFITDRVYHTCTLGLEKHMIEMFGDAGLGVEEARLKANERGKIQVAPEPEAREQELEAYKIAEELRAKATQLAVESGAAVAVKAPPVAAITAELVWTDEAQKALKQIPFFVRPKVQKRVEEYARSHGYSLITLDLVYEVREKAQQ